MLNGIRSLEGRTGIVTVVSFSPSLLFQRMRRSAEASEGSCEKGVKMCCGKDDRWSIISPDSHLLYSLGAIIFAIVFSIAVYAASSSGSRS